MNNTPAVSDTQSAPATATPQTMPSLLDQTLRLAEAAGRQDLVQRLKLAQERVLDPRRRIIVVGALKQGKSQFVNSMVDLNVCSVGDDETTEIPTVVQFGTEPAAQLVVEATVGKTSSLPIPPADVISAAARTKLADGKNVVRLEISAPSRLLQDGIVVVDTPGVGGHASPHSSSVLGMIPWADAVLFLSDASTELTEPEIAFLKKVRALCPTVACLLTKTDLYPFWRDILSADQRHLASAELELPIFGVSSVLRSHALRLQDKDLNAESGFNELYTWLRDQVVAPAQTNTIRGAALDIKAVTEHLKVAVSSELTTLSNPETGVEAVAGLQRARQVAEDLQRRSAQWQVTLADGFADLVADVDHDLRDRLREVNREAEKVIDSEDPGRDWEAIGDWLTEQVGVAVGDNFVWMHERAVWLADRIAEHFVHEGEVELPKLSTKNLDTLLDPVTELGDVESGHLTISQKVLMGMRGSYGGVLMFGLATSLAGMALINPISLGAGALIGAKQYKEEKTGLLERRRNMAKTVVRQYTDDVNFQVGKESRDRLREIQRVLRDHFTKLAEQTLRSISDSMKSSQESATLESGQRRTRIEHLRRQLAVIEAANVQATKALPALISS